MRERSEVPATQYGQRDIGRSFLAVREEGCLERLQGYSGQLNKSSVCYDVMDAEGCVASLLRRRSQKVQPPLWSAAEDPTVAHKGHEFDAEDAGDVLTSVVDSVSIALIQSVHHFRNVWPELPLFSRVDS